MRKRLKLGLMLGLFALGASLLAVTPVVYATWHYSTFSCSLTPGNGCGQNWDGALQLTTKVDSTSPSTYICAGYVITSGTGSGTGKCIVVYSNGAGSTFNNDGTQTVDSFYLDCTASACGGYSGVSISGTFADSAFINAPRPRIGIELKDKLGQE
jgi:hypothetical protein